MPIVLVRVDDRLIHGQILESWIPSTRAQELIVANDTLADDQVQKMIMQAAIPYSVDLIIDSVLEVASILQQPEGRDVRRMVIVEDPVDALRLRRAGVVFDQLNLGNLVSSEVTICLSRTVSIGGESLQALRTILQEGIKVNIQSVPFEKAVDLSEFCQRAKKVMVHHEV
ncbi:MAG: PTS sugar transporter subunit IIB [Deltaproteobacteria bacterium]|nr:PTS sugar transporter subunit IIB [Deltaproteobacteria bacterium]